MESDASMRGVDAVSETTSSEGGRLAHRERGTERRREKRRLDRGVKVGTELLGRATRAVKPG